MCLSEISVLQLWGCEFCFCHQHDLMWYTVLLLDALSHSLQISVQTVTLEPICNPRYHKCNLSNNKNELDIYLFVLRKKSYKIIKDIEEVKFIIKLHIFQWLLPHSVKNTPFSFKMSSRQFRNKFLH